MWRKRRLRPHPCLPFLALAAALPAGAWQRTGFLRAYGAEYDPGDFIVYAFYGHKREHAAQIAVYQSYLTLHEHPALFTAVNADTMEIYAELIPFDAGLAQRMSDRAVKVIQATEAGELLPRSFAESTHFECRFCAWAERCWK